MGENADLMTPRTGLVIVEGLHFILTVARLSDNSSTALWSLGEDGNWCMRKWPPIVSTGKFKDTDTSEVY